MKTPPLVALCLGLPACVIEPDRIETSEFRGVSVLDVASGAGDIELYAVDGDTLVVDAVIYGKRTRARAEQGADGALRLWQAGCRFNATCVVDYTIGVPAGLALYLDTGAGDIQVTDVAAGRVEVDTGSGDVVARGATIDVLVGSTGSGDVSAELIAPPATVDLDTGAGDIEVIVPAGTYDISIDTGVGDKHIEGVTSTSGADRRIVLDTGAGDAEVRGVASH